MTWAQILKRARRIGQQYEAGGYWTPEEWLVVANQVQIEIIQQTEGILVHDSSKTTTASVSYIEIPNTLLNIRDTCRGCFTTIVDKDEIGRAHV